MYAKPGIGISCVAYSNDLVEQLETRKLPTEASLFYIFSDPGNHFLPIVGHQYDKSMVIERLLL